MSRRRSPPSPPDPHARRADPGVRAAPRLGIVGGGMLGLTLALRLRAVGYDVTVYEAADRPGGLAAPWSIGDFTWDKFYHVILMSDLNVRRLLDELGLTDALRWNTTRTGFFTDGRLFSMSDSLEFLRFPPLRLVDKLRLGGTIFYASRRSDWRALESIPVTDWLRRLSGDRTFEKIWLPLLRAKLGENYGNANAAFIWATISRMYAARRSGLKREMFGFVDGGYDTIVSRLETVLADAGVSLRCGVRVARVETAGAGQAVVLADGTRSAFDAVVMTTPATHLPELCPELSDAERARLAAITYHGIVCASMLLRRPLADYYVTNITDPGVPFTAVIEMTALVDRERFGGHALVYLPRYLTQTDAFWQADDATVRGAFLAAIARMYPAFSPDDVVAFQVARARQVMALPTLNYSTTLMPKTTTSRPGLFIVGSAQIPDGTLNVNETIGLAERALPVLRDFLER
ncbi:NAD(P)/FAD-dependent oxidoreductase [Myxococcota bacterium]|nr:NAD(P)/FAD-dependent oxidoreductase [Myxococcota bacterium]